MTIRPCNITRTSNESRRIIGEVLKVAGLKQPVTANDYAAIIQYRGEAPKLRFREFRHKVSLIPWLTITPAANGWVFEVDYELKQFCDNHKPGTVGPFSIVDHLSQLRKEIARVRKEQKCERQRKVWNSNSTDAVQLKMLLDYIEQQLDAIPTTRKAQKPVVLPNRAHGAEKENHHDQKAGGTHTGVDARTGEVVCEHETAAGGAGIKTLAD